MNKFRLTSILGVFVVASALLFPMQTSNAACVQTKATGKTVGEIQVGNVTMPIKPFTYPAGGIMEPQKSVQMAAVSLRHQPLNATMGTSVIVWHINYAGCVNPLNTLTYKSVGFKFQITDAQNNSVTYKITNMYKVKKGNYKQSWFNVIGPRQLLLATCGGNFVNGHYQDNAVIIAKPVTEA